MPAYEIEVDGKMYEIESAQPLKDADFVKYARAFAPPQETSLASQAREALGAHVTGLMEGGPGAEVSKGALQLAGAGAESAVRQLGGGLKGLAYAAKNLYDTGGDIDSAVRSGAEAVRSVTEPKKPWITPTGQFAELATRAAGQGAEAVNEAAGTLEAVSPTSLVRRGLRTAVQGPEAAGLAEENMQQTARESMIPMAGVLVPGSRFYNKMRAARALPLGTMDQQAHKIYELQRAGYSFNPAKANPTALNELVSSMGGKYLDEKLAAKSVGDFNRAGRRSLGFSEDTMLDRDAFNGYRNIQAEAYREIRRLSPVRPDSELTTRLHAIHDNLINESFPGANSGAITRVQSIIGDIEVPKGERYPGAFSTSDTLRHIQQLRDEARDTLRSSSPSSEDRIVAFSKIDIAHALEDQLERHVAGSAPELLNNYRTARANIARSYDIEYATDVAGNIDANKIARLLDKNKPLTQDLRQMAEYARLSPRTAKPASRVNPTTGFEASDLGNVGILWRLWHTPKAAAFALGRPIAASVGASDWYQSTMGRPRGTIPQQYGLSSLPIPLGQQDETADR